SVTRLRSLPRRRAAGNEFSGGHFYPPVGPVAGRAGDWVRRGGSYRDASFLLAGLNRDPALAAGAGTLQTTGLTTFRQRIGSSASPFSGEEGYPSFYSHNTF